MKFPTSVFILKRKITLVTIAWFLLAALGALLKIRLGLDKIGNYVLFERVFYNALDLNNLYYVDPLKDLGSFLYGPLFSVLIAPFAILTTNAGAFFWAIANAAILYFAFRRLPVSYSNQNIILGFSLVEMMTSIQNMQINCIITALIIFSFIFVQKQKDFWATLFIAAGFLIKIYGIVGLVFFLFSDNKLKFCLSFVFWLVVLFCLPMLFSSPSFILHSYIDWFHTLIEKDALNANSEMQNISVQGMLRHVINVPNLNLWIVAIAALMYGLPLLRRQMFSKLNFRLTYLAAALIGVVIFSSSAESPTYIIAVAGVGIWYVIQNKKQVLPLILLITTFWLTSLSSTDLFPAYLKTTFVRPYALKALPCFLVWLVIMYQLLIENFSQRDEVSQYSSSMKGL
jgi:Glycosyltransferase family 87